MAKKKTKSEATAFVAIEFDVLESLRKLPEDFWLKVPTVSERRRCAGLSATDFIKGTLEHTRPAFCDEYPGFAELWDKFLSPAEEHCYDKPNGVAPEHNWVESVIGDARFRCRTKYGHYRTARDWNVTHKDFDVLQDTWYAPGNLYCGRISWEALPGNPRAKKKQDTYDKRKWYEDELKPAFRNKAFGRLWNKLRKDARRKAGLDLPPQQAKALATKKQAVAITKAKMSVLLHLDDLIQELESYKAEVAGEDDSAITAKRVRRIFDMTNTLTSKNATLKKALKV